MKYNLSLILIFISVKLFAQTTQITKSDEKLRIRQKITVLKSDKKIWDGKYTEYDFYNNKLLCEGYYKNNLKDSTWKYFSYTQRLAEIGNYKADKRIGAWNAYNYKGELELQYDYDSDSLIFYKPTNRDSIQTEYHLINGKDTSVVTVDRGPIFLDGSVAMGKPMISTIRYPAEARNQHIQGTVIVAFKINLDGTASGYRVVQSLGYGCDEEALNAIKRISGQWLPAIYQGKQVVVEKELPVSFTLDY
ncbi:energy transducer TonB [Mucilaginibacter sp. CAU 1740]|uniref:energy transducer TonB n=1 Tax=Mucilaginibacter sp. CAU 1740 TaxID=3140365 RepID=UPI00325A5531